MKCSQCVQHVTHDERRQRALLYKYQGDHLLETLHLVLMNLDSPARNEAASTSRPVRALTSTTPVREATAGHRISCLPPRNARFNQIGAASGGLSSAGKSSLHIDDSTVVTSNLSKNLKSRRLVAPKIATLPDDDPSCDVQKPAFSPVSDNIEDGDTHIKRGGMTL